ncbi:hypothetical protein HPB52_015627 [Rhipicephalus sanguineus]|uniref:Uncharacterized protein n=1 Tax=Rhipicephalus sanguineus TaxID=34632 RepID=A0A9D4PRZ2_RHISA|nr:hypothetical protein HPB52_015627 [Rhipicephalus sanguineus]
MFSRCAGDCHHGYGLESPSLEVVTMETTSSDQAMPSENVYLADMVKLWERKQSQAAASSQGQRSRAGAQQKAAASGSSLAPLYIRWAHCSSLLANSKKSSGDPAPRLARDRSGEASRSSRLKSVLPSDRTGDAIRTYLR